MASIADVGYAVVQELLPRDEVDALRDELYPMVREAPWGSNPAQGFRTRRIARLLARTRSVDPLVLHPLLTELAWRLLDHHQLTSPSVIEVCPGETDQELHFEDVYYPIGRPHPPLVLNSLWALDDFTRANGATRFVPGSHHWASGRLPTDADPVEVVEVPAGSVILFPGETWHGAGANSTCASRIAIALEFVRSWLRTQETGTLAVPPEIAGSLPTRIRDLLGYNVTPQGLGHVGGVAPWEHFEGWDPP